MKQQKYLVSAILLSTLLAMILAACAPTAPQATPAPTETRQPTPTFPPTYTPAPTSTATITATPLPTPIAGPLFDWPILALTDEQIQSVLECETETWGSDDELNPGLITIENPATACEYGLQAITHVSNPDTLSLKDEGIVAAQQALLKNPGIALANPYFFFSFSALEIVPAPPFTESPLKTATVEYSWGGMGIPVEFQLDIQAGNTLIASGVVVQGEDPISDTSDNAATNQLIEQEISPDSFQRLGTSLANLLPITQQGYLFACFDNYPDWTITLVYQEGAEIVLKTNGSNYYFVGGPFQAEIDGQNYVMVSNNFNNALLEIINELEIELGQPFATSCFADSPAAIFLGGSQ